MTHLRSWLLVLALSLLTASPAAATTFYVGPNSTRTAQPCSQDTPCKLDYALLAAGHGDKVSAAPGDYYDHGTTPYAGLPPVAAGATLQGSSTTDLPVLHGHVGAQNVPFLEVPDQGVISDVQLVSDLEVSATVTSGLTLRLADGATANRVLVRATAPAGATMIACDVGAVDLVNSACIGSGAGYADGVAAHATSGTHSLNATNVTAIGAAPSGFGLVLATDTGTMKLTAHNVIAKGPTDVGVFANNATGSAQLSLDHSNWATQTTSGLGTAQVVEGAGNQHGATAAPPLFVNAAAGDYREARGSRTIDSGVSTLAVPPVLALGGLPRTLGARPDIGAYEYQPTPTAVTGAATNVGDSGATLAGTVTPDGAPVTARFEYGTTTAYGRTAAATGATAVSATLTGLAPETTYHYRLVATSPGGGTGRGQDRTFRTTAPAASAQAAVLSRVSIGRRWRLGRNLPSFSRKRPPVGTTIRYTLSRGARVTLTFRQRVKRGRRARLVKRGSLITSGFAGANKVRFEGRLSRRKKLKPGRYVLTVTVAGSSRSGSASFTIVR